MDAQEFTSIVEKHIIGQWLIQAHIVDHYVLLITYPGDRLQINVVEKGQSVSNDHPLQRNILGLKESIHLGQIKIKKIEFVDGVTKLYLSDNSCFTITPSQHIHPAMRLELAEPNVKASLAASVTELTARTSWRHLFR